MINTHCTSEQCILKYQCGRFSRQTGTDNDLYRDFLKEARTDLSGLDCCYYLEKYIKSNGYTNS